MRSVALSSFALAALPALTLAHTGCGGHEIGRRNPGGEYIPDIRRRQTTSAAMAAPTDEASGAVSTDPTYECTGYSYGPVANIINSYPTVWQTASLPPNDTEAMALFATINATVNAKLPNDVPHGTANGDFQGVNYTSADPDCWWTWRQCDTPAASTGLPPDITTVPEPMTWGLGFDDGPNCSHNALYDYLQSQNQKATMFYIGSNVMDWPLQALRATTEGHHICVHTWSHQYMTSFSNEVAFAELYYTRKVIQEVLGVTPLCWRPPFGDVDNRIRMIAQGLNLTTIVWSDDTEDWKEGVPADNVTPADVASNYEAIVGKTKNGTYTTHGPVVLNHELTNFTMSEFISQYPSIKGAFSHIVPLCTAMNWTHPYAEQNITCPDFATYTGSSSSSNSSSGGSASGSSGASGTGSATGSASSAGSSSSSSNTKSAASRSISNGLGALAAFAGLSVGAVVLL